MTPRTTSITVAAQTFFEAVLDMKTLAQCAVEGDKIGHMTKVGFFFVDDRLWNGAVIDGIAV